MKNSAVKSIDDILRPFAGRFTEEFSRFDRVIKVDCENLPQLLTAFKEGGFNYLADVTAVDQGEHFTVFYRVHTLPGNQQALVTVDIDRDQAILPSVVGVWGAADWQERELYDLMGIHFEGHPNLTRILLPDEFEGHPLRRDYKRGRDIDA